ncbi:MAG: tetratricopeptide repeat protein [Candidatus Aminicenantaceae bacterium]
MRKMVILLFLLSLCIVHGWSQHGKIIGTVTDKEGNPQEKVTVTIVSVKSSAKKTEVETNKEGKFSQVGLWPDYYHVSFKKTGFMPISREVRVRIASPTEMEIILDKAQDMMERNLSAADKLFLKGNKLYAEQKYDEAIQAYNEALELSQSQWGYFFNLGLAYKKSDNKEDAIATFKKALEMNPESYSINKELGELLALEENYEEAKKYYAKAAEISDDDPDAFYNLGVCLTNLGDQEGALTAFLKTIGFKEDYADAYYQVGTLYINQNNVEEAVKNLEKFLELAPEHEKANVTKQLLDYLKK